MPASGENSDWGFNQKAGRLGAWSSVLSEVRKIAQSPVRYARTHPSSRGSIPPWRSFHFREKDQADRSADYVDRLLIDEREAAAAAPDPSGSAFAR